MAGEMVDLKSLKFGDVQSIKPGDFLLVSRRGEQRRFIAGPVEREHRMVIELSDMQPARAVDWMRQPGLVFEDFRFEVEIGSEVVINDDKPIGSLAILDGHPAIMVPRDRPGTWYWMLLDVDSAPEFNIPDDTLVFTRWRIAWGSEDEPVELFKFGPTVPTSKS